MPRRRKDKATTALPDDDAMPMPTIELALPKRKRGRPQKAMAAEMHPVQQLFKQRGVIVNQTEVESVGTIITIFIPR
jgi:hypothetical protein